MVAGIRQQLFERDVSCEVIPNSDRELVERYSDRIVLKTGTIEVWWSGATRQDDALVTEPYSELPDDSSVTILPWMPPTLKANKGIMHAPAGRTTMQPGTRRLCFRRSRRRACGLMISSPAGSSPWRRSLGRKIRSNATCVCLQHWHSLLRSWLCDRRWNGTALALKVTNLAEALPAFGSDKALVFALMSKDTIGSSPVLYCAT